MSGFKKCGIYPLNPGEVTNRQLAPSRAVHPQPENDDISVTPLFSPEQEALYRLRFDEGYDINDASYIAWLKLNHPEVDVSVASSSSSGKKTAHSNKVSSPSDTLSEILVLPQPQARASTRKRKPAINKKTVCITDDDVLEELRVKETEKKEAEEKKRMKQIEKEQKRKQREEKKREEKKREEEEKKKKRATEKELRKTKEQLRAIDKVTAIGELLEELELSSDTSNDESDAVCPMCGRVYSDDNGIWICCDGCNSWFDIKCTNIRSRRNIPDTYLCENCM